MVKYNILTYILLFFAWYTNVYGMTFDNKYLPLFFKPWIRHINRPTHWRVQPLFFRSEGAHGDHTGDNLGLPELDGIYDQAELSRSLIDADKVKYGFFDTNTVGIGNVPWRQHGRISAEGMAFYYEQPFAPCWFFGTSFLFAHISSHNEFELDRSSMFGPGDRYLLFDLKSRSHKVLGLKPACFSKTVFSDLDLYILYSRHLDYTCKCKSIDANLKFGVIAPTSPAINLNNPASVPLGYNKHWGAYLSLESQFELKEDWYAGLLLRATKRFKHAQNSRIPIGLEPTRYGVELGNLEVNPGWTFVFYPWIMLAGLREGFGLTGQYVLIAHLEDGITDRRANQDLSSRLHRVHSRSSWGSEYVTLGAFYDFAQNKDCQRFLPTVSIYWDMPVAWQVSKRSSKTYSVSLMIEASF